MSLTLAEMLSKAIKGEITLFKGVFTPEEKLPAVGFRVPIPKELQPIVSLYCAFSNEHERHHRLMTERGDTERSTRHKILHEWRKITGSMIVVDLEQTKPEGAGRFGVIISPEEFFWYISVPGDPRDGLTLLDVLAGNGLGNILDIKA